MALFAILSAMADRKSTPTIDAKTAIEQFQDYLAPQLDVYEQAMYLYILRHSRLEGKPRVTVELKSARHQIARGLGRRGSRLGARTCLDKLRSLDAKGCIALSGTRESAPTVRVFLPSEMPGLTEQIGDESIDELESMDFFNEAINRRRILKREGSRCFYCRRKLNDSNTAIDHVSSRPAGDNGYRNVVASCKRCNNRKGDSSPEDLLRVLFREAIVNADLLSDRLEAIQMLREGRLRP